MADYRIFVLNQRRRIDTPAIVVSCETDEEAVRHAHAHVDRTAVQIWDGNRIVAELPPKAIYSNTQQINSAVDTGGANSGTSCHDHG